MGFGPGEPLAGVVEAAQVHGELGHPELEAGNGSARRQVGAASATNPLPDGRAGAGGR